VAAVLSIIENSAIVGDIASIARSGYIDAYTHGITFLVVFDPKNTEAYWTKTVSERRASVVKMVNQVGGIRPAMHLTPLAIIANSHLDSLVPDLKQMYPNVTILTSDEAYGFFTNLQPSSSLSIDNLFLLRYNIFTMKHTHTIITWSSFASCSLPIPR